MNLVAKPIIKNQYWVITDGDKKVGNVESQGTGFDVKFRVSRVRVIQKFTVLVRVRDRRVRDKVG